MALEASRWLRHTSLAAALPISFGALGLALFAAGAPLSGCLALVVGGLLLDRHPRARFAAYICLTALCVRGLGSGPRWAVWAALVGIVLLQTPPARRTWPPIPFGSRQPGAASLRTGPAQAAENDGRACASM